MLKRSKRAPFEVIARRTDYGIICEECYEGKDHPRIYADDSTLHDPKLRCVVCNRKLFTLHSLLTDTQIEEIEKGLKCK